MKIVPLLGGNSEDPIYLEYIKLIKCVLEAFVPTFFEEKGLKARLEKELPFLQLREERGCSTNVSFFLISKSRPDAFKFFFEMIYRWLVPGAHLNVVLIHAVDFNLPHLDTTVYNLSEIVVKLENDAQLELIKQALPLVENEIKRGISSKREASKILESKGYKQDEKTAVLQERLGERIDRFPKIYQPDLFREMQHTLLLAPEGFKLKRSVSHLLKLILYQYRFRKDLLSHIQAVPHKRRVLLKLIRFPFEGKDRVGVVVGMNFLEDKELFEEKQLINALNHHFPFIRPSGGSSLYSRRGKELLTTVYTEIEHSDGGSFSDHELAEISRELPKDILSHVEYIMHPVFMPRNEEEIMRNMLTLAGQLKYAQDFPQGFITFDQQTRTNLFFTFIFVRVVHENSKAIPELFKNESEVLSFIPDRIKNVGSLGKKYSKEAAVFRVRLRKEQFLRLDHSIDLYKARQVLVNEITRIGGEFRDFNGGMIAKTEELLVAVKSLLNERGTRYNALWLENFFYSLTPSVMQTLLSPKILSEVFYNLSELLKKGLPHHETSFKKIYIEDEWVCVLYLAHERGSMDEFEKLAKGFQTPAVNLVMGELAQGDTLSSAVILLSKESKKQARFIDHMK